MHKQAVGLGTCKLDPPGPKSIKLNRLHRQQQFHFAQQGRSGKKSLRSSRWWIKQEPSTQEVSFSRSPGTILKFMCGACKKVYYCAFCHCFDFEWLDCHGNCCATHKTFIGVPRAENRTLSAPLHLNSNRVLSVMLLHEFAFDCSSARWMLNGSRAVSTVGVDVSRSLFCSASGWVLLLFCQVGRSLPAA